jgi:small subunit ribosomal protein S3Ae
MATKLSDKKAKTMKKKWFPIIAPKIFNEIVMGESLLYEASDAIGRTATANMMQLTGDVKSQNTTLKFLITEARDGKLYTVPKEYQIGGTSIKRIIRRRQDKLEDSILASTADGKRIRIKPIIITRAKAKGSVKNLIRRALRLEVLAFVKKNTFEQIFTLVMSFRIQKELKEKLNKIYPVKFCEIRDLIEEKKNVKKESEPIVSHKMTKKKEKVKDKKSLEDEGVKEEIPEGVSEEETEGPAEDAPAAEEKPEDSEEKEVENNA